MKRILLFGGSSDVGEAILKELDDYEIYATKHTGDIRVPTHKQYVCDLRELEDINTVIQETPELDSIIFSAMPEILKPIEDFQGYLQAEKLLRGQVYALTKAIPKLKRGARIITISGQSADTGLPAAPYMGANFAYLHNLAKSSNAINARKQKFSMHDLQVGPIDTKMWQRVSQEAKKNYDAHTEEYLQPQTVAQYVRMILEADVAPTKIVVDNYYSLP